AAERFGDEPGVRLPRFGFADQTAPESLWHLVSSIAAEAFKPQPEQMLDHPEAIAIKALGIARVTVIELSEVLPDDSLAVVLAGGVRDAPVRLPDEPLGVLTRQRRINGAMIDHQVEHDLQAGGAGLGDHVADLVLRRSRALKIQQHRINVEVVRDGIQTAGRA